MSNFWKYILMILLGMFLMYQCGDSFKNESDLSGLVSKNSYDSINNLYFEAKEMVNRKEIVIGILQKKKEALMNVKENLKPKYSKTKSEGRITIIDNPCNVDSAIYAYDKLSANCDSMNAINDSIQESLSLQIKEHKELSSYKDTMIVAANKIIDLQKSDIDVYKEELNKEKKQNRRLKIKNIIVTSVAILASSLAIYSTIKK